MSTYRQYLQAKITEIRDAAKVYLAEALGAALTYDEAPSRGNAIQCAAKQLRHMAVIRTCDRVNRCVVLQEPACDERSVFMAVSAEIARMGDEAARFAESGEGAAGLFDNETVSAVRTVHHEFVDASMMFGFEED